MNKKYLFIRGYQKSGTNWLSNLVNLHESIHSNGEFHFKILLDAKNRYLNNDFRIKFEKEVSRGLEEVVKRILVKNVSGDKLIYYGDRTPLGIEPIIIEDSPILFIVRDGRDVMISQIYHRMRHLHNDVESAPEEFKRVIAKHPFLKSKLEYFRNEIDYFERKPTKLLTSEKYVREYSKHWNNFIIENFQSVEKIKSGKIKAKIHCIRYEDLHGDLDGQLDNIFKFLDLDPTKRNPFDDKTRPGFKKTNNLSLYRKGKTKEWERYFTDEQLKWFMDESKEAFNLIEQFFDKRALQTA